MLITPFGVRAMHRVWASRFFTNPDDRRPMLTAMDDFDSLFPNSLASRGSPWKSSALSLRTTPKARLKDHTKRTTSSVSGKHLQVLNRNRPDSPDRGQLLLPRKPPPHLRRARGSRETDLPTLQDLPARPSPTNQIPDYVLVQHRHYMEGEEL